MIDNLTGRKRISSNELRRNSIASQRRERGQVKIQILSDSTVHPLPKILASYASELGLTIAVLQNRTLEPVGESFNTQSDIDAVVVIVSLELLAPNGFLSSIHGLPSANDLKDSVLCAIEQIIHNVSRRGRKVFINLMAPRLLQTLYMSRASIRETFENINMGISELCLKYDSLKYDFSFSDYANNEQRWRNYFSFKKIYSNSELECLARTVVNSLVVANGLGKKLLILDCDNTLWTGVLGEVGSDKIEIIDRKHPDRSPFYLAQRIIADLQSLGVLIGICSKNNEAEVLSVFNDHKDMYLRPQHIVAFKVNWKPKHENIIEITNELNIALSSVIFIDDNPFEMESVKRLLPEVHCCAVPKITSNYPEVLMKIIPLFSVDVNDETSRLRTADYLANKERNREREKNADFDDYLRSLDMSLLIRLNDISKASRISQMTLRTNQFNLLTNRFSEQEVIRFIDEGGLVYHGELSDKHGNSGVIILIMFQVTCDKTLKLVNFLTSCRALGRGVEVTFWEYIANRLHDGAEIRVGFVPTMKNEQVKNFFDAYFSSIEEHKTGQKYYESLIPNITRDRQHINVTFVKG